MRAALRRWTIELAEWSLHHRILLLVVVGALSAAALVVVATIDTAHDDVAMRPVDPPQQQLDLEFQRVFGNDDLLVLAVHLPAALRQEDLNWIGQLSHQLESRTGVERVLSITTAQQLRPGRYGAEVLPLLEAAPGDELDLEITARVRAALAWSPHFRGLLISDDLRTLGLLILLEAKESAPPIDLVLADLRATLDAARLGAPAGSKLWATGVPLQTETLAHATVRDQRTIMPIAVFVLGAALLLWTRSWRRTAAILLVAGLTALWTMALYGVLGFNFNVLTSLLPPVLLVLTMCCCLHLDEEWQTQKFESSVRSDITHRVLRLQGVPVALTVLTTALGLASLAINSTPAVQLFGLFGALGSVLGLCLAVALLPLLFSPRRSVSTRRQDPDNPRRLQRILAWTAERTISSPRRVLLVAALATAVLAPGIARVRNNTDLVHFLRPGAQLRIDTLAIDAQLMGASGLDLLVRRRDGATLTAVDDVERLQAFLDRLTDSERITNAFGLPDLIAQVYRAEFERPALELPADRGFLLECFDLLDEAEDRDLVDRMVTADHRMTRIHLRIHSTGSAAAAALMAEITTAREQTLGADYDVQPAGDFYRIIRDSDQLVRSQLRSLALALLSVFLVLTLVLRNLRQLLGALATNLLPLLWSAGLMGWLGIDLSTATAMVASTTLGIVVDDTIHYLTWFRRRSDRGRASAIRRTTRNVGRVLVRTSLILTLGFWVGLFGSFLPTAYYCLLTGITVLGALIADLFVLPAILMLGGPRTPKT